MNEPAYEFKGCNCLRTSPSILSHWETCPAYDPEQQPETITFQRQDSLDAQLQDLVRIANKEGMYDAADWLQAQLDSSRKE